MVVFDLLSCSCWRTGFKCLCASWKTKAVYCCCGCRRVCVCGPQCVYVWYGSAEDDDGAAGSSGQSTPSCWLVRIVEQENEAPQQSGALPDSPSSVSFWLWNHRSIDISCRRTRCARQLFLPFFFLQFYYLLLPGSNILWWKMWNHFASRYRILVR